MPKTRIAPAITLRQRGLVEIQLYTPHNAQKRLHRCKKRFRVAACGRRFGKTLCAANELVEFMVKHKYCNCVWVSPRYRQCKVVYRLLKYALRDIIVHHSDQELRLTLWNGAVLTFYSATNYDTMRGEGFDAAVVDETQDIPEDAWQSVLRPTLATTMGWVIFLGTPKGQQNWFFTLYQRGTDPLEMEWESFHFPTSANPYVPREELETAKKDLPEDVYNQEYEAEFLEYAASVFKGLDACIAGDYEEIIPDTFYLSQAPLAGDSYSIGIDWAKYHDFTAMSVLNNRTMHLDALYRINHMDYTVQIERAAYISHLFNNAPILSDATGVGDPLLEMAKSKGLAIEGFVYTRLSKKMLFEELQVAIQYTNITIPKIPILVSELQAVRYKVTPGREITYETPRGLHDDTVNSLALAKHAIGDTLPIPISLTGDHEDNPIKDYPDPELMQRQARVSQFLGDVQLVYGDSNEGW